MRVPEGFGSAEALGLRPFELNDQARVLLPCRRRRRVELSGDALSGSAARLLELAGAPPQALIPLMQRTIENGFELTGPIARGDWATVDLHLAAIAAHAPDLEEMYRALAKVTVA